jgi:hypothetical protein
VRIEGETGSYRPPQWADTVDSVGGMIDSAVDASLGDKTLAQLLDEQQSGVANA